MKTINKEEYAIAYKVLGEIQKNVSASYDTPLDRAICCIPILQGLILRTIEKEEQP